MSTSLPAGLKVWPQEATNVEFRDGVEEYAGHCLQIKEEEEE